MMAYEYINKIGEVNTHSDIVKVCLAAQIDIAVSSLDMLDIRQAALDRIKVIEGR